MDFPRNLSSEEIERQFVKTFVISTIQDRANYELTSEKKRDRFFSRLAHSHPLVLKQKLMIKIPRLRAEQEISEIMRMLKTRGAGTHCYIMSGIKGLDGERLPIEEGICRCAHCGMEAILICSDKLAFFTAERVSASPPRFILQRV
jgi:hypothetical protein